jgi:hypothetical protein
MPFVELVFETMVYCFVVTGLYQRNISYSRASDAFLPYLVAMSDIIGTESL